MTRTAVILINLGTPEEPTAPAVRRYLREFLSDRRVIDKPAWMWRPILELAVLPVRPRASAEKYRLIWTPEGSPLMLYSEAQAAALREALGDDVVVEIAMTYGSPAIADVLADVTRRGCDRILLVPLYPQYSVSSAGALLDRALHAAAALPHHPEVRAIRAYPDDDGYIHALCSALEARWAEAGRPDPDAGDRLILSYHSIPQAMADGGDPYEQECELTTSLVAERVGLPPEAVLTTYQSKFGMAPWLGPATIDTVEKLGKQGCRRLDVMCPGFVSDCLETLEEICILNAETFRDAGGGEFTYIHWGNDRKEWTDALAGIVRGHLWADSVAQ